MNFYNTMIFMTIICNDKSWVMSMVATVAVSDIDLNWRSAIMSHIDKN